MCRMIAYLGPPVTLEELLLTAEHGLLEQAWAPRYQTSGVVNADGFGAGWYDPARRPEPARYRSARPLWADRSFASLAGVVASGAVLAAVRSATPPAPSEESGAPPFTSGPWLFAHNGAVPGFRDGLGVRLRRSLSAHRAAEIEGTSDAEVLFALTLDRLDQGAAPGEAVADVVAGVQAASGGRSGLNLLLTDGTRVAATTWGHSLFSVADERTGMVTVASEPSGPRRDWQALPDRSLLEATTAGITVRPLEPALQTTP